MTSSSAPRVYRIGDAMVTRILDTQLTVLRPEQLLPDWSTGDARDATDPLLRGSMSASGEHVVLSVHSWLVRIGGKVVIVDTGIGNGKERPFSRLFHDLKTDYLARLRQAGVTPGDVDMVLLTHLHVDHVGWNTVRGAQGWVPTFANARHVYAQAEEDHFHTPAGAARRMVYEDSVLPLIESGLVERVGEQGARVDAHFAFLPTPGHSVGHMSIALESRGETALFGGDVMHHPVQLIHPTWSSCFCTDPERASASRARMLDFVRRKRALYFSSHFADTSVVAPMDESGAAVPWRFV